MSRGIRPVAPRTDPSCRSEAAPTRAHLDVPRSEEPLSPGASRRLVPSSLRLVTPTCLQTILVHKQNALQKLNMQKLQAEEKVRIGVSLPSRLHCQCPASYPPNRLAVYGTPERGSHATGGGRPPSIQEALNCDGCNAAQRSTQLRTVEGGPPGPRIQHRGSPRLAAPCVSCPL